jgi:hypothetical protein
MLQDTSKKMMAKCQHAAVVAGCCCCLRHMEETHCKDARCTCIQLEKGHSEEPHCRVELEYTAVS